MKKTITLDVEFSNVEAYNILKNKVVALVTEHAKNDASTSNGFTSPKNIGKRLTQLLDDEELSFEELSEAFEESGLNASTVDFLDGLVWEQEEATNKRVGKKVAYFIENGKMDAAPLLALLNAA